MGVYLRFITIRKAPVLGLTNGTLEPTGDFLERGTVIDGMRAIVEAKGGKPIHVIEIAPPSPKLKYPRKFVMPSDVEDYRGRMHFNYTEGEKESGRLGGLIEFGVGLVLLFVVVYIISRAWKKGQGQPACK